MNCLIVGLMRAWWPSSKQTNSLGTRSKSQATIGNDPKGQKSSSDSWQFFMFGEAIMLYTHNSSESHQQKYLKSDWQVIQSLSNKRVSARACVCFLACQLNSLLQSEIQYLNKYWMVYHEIWCIHVSQWTNPKDFGTPTTWWLEYGTILQEQSPRSNHQLYCLMLKQQTKQISAALRIAKWKRCAASRQNTISFNNQLFQREKNQSLHWLTVYVINRNNSAVLFTYTFSSCC